MGTPSFPAALGVLLLLLHRNPDGSPPPRGPAPGQVSFEERYLGTLPEGKLDEWFNVSHFGVLWYRATIGDKTFTVVGGRKMWEFPTGAFEKFSPGGEIQAHWERRGGDHWLVLDDREFGPFEDHSGPAFSREGRMVYAGKRHGRWTLYTDSKAQPVAEGTTEVTLVDGDRVSVVTQGERDGKRFVGVDGREWEYKGTLWMAPEVSPSGSVALLIGEKEGEATRKRLIVNGVAVEAWDDLSWPPVFSGDGRRIACVVQQNSRSSLFVDGSIVTQDQYSIAHPTFSPGGRRLAYRIEVTGAEGVLGGAMVVDGRQSELFTRNVGWPNFSPDGQRVAYRAEKGDRQFVVLDGVQGPEFGTVCPRIYFSPDSKRVASIASDGRGPGSAGWKCAVDGTQGEVYEEIQDFIFSPDSKHLAYVALDRGKYRIVMDGHKGGAFDRAWMPVFQADSRKVAFGARRGRDLWWKVIDVPR